MCLKIKYRKNLQKNPHKTTRASRKTIYMLENHTNNTWQCLCNLNVYWGVIVGDARMSSGSEFQTVGASKAKVKPNCLVDL